MTLRARAALTAAVAAVTVSVTVAGCGAVATWHPARSSTEAGSAINWRLCGSDARKINRQLPAGLEVHCGVVEVPQDWNTAKDGKAPDGKTFELSLMRVRSERQANRIGSLLLNPGGPGGSGVELAAHLSGRVPKLLERFDLIGFDPRGVGRSKPPVDCISTEDLDASFGYEPDPVSDAAYQGAVALYRRIAEGCEQKHGQTLSLYSTEQSARDIDAIRAAVGDEKLSYLGFSYGTLLGAVYANLFPRNIRAMVLDGAVDPQQSSVISSEGQARGFELAFSNFEKWCKANTGSCPIAPNPRAAVQSVMDTARRSPVKGPDGREATSGWVLTSVVLAMYSADYWEPFANSVALLRRGDATLTFVLADAYASRENGEYTNMFDAFNAINCVDSDQHPTVEDIRRLQSQWRAKYPLFGPALAIGLLNCAVWPAKKDPYPVGPATGSPPIVVVGTTGDPATPYESTAKLSNLLGTGTVVTWEGEGHTAYPETACIRNAVERYLIDLQKPAAGLTCPAS